MANLLNIYKYPQISYGAMDPMFSDKARFPYFFRTIPSDHIQNAAIIQLLKEFGWTWVGILFSNDESSSRGSEELKKDIIKSGICIEFLLLLPAHEHEKNADRTYNILKNSSAKVIIIYSTFGYTLILLVQIYKFGLIEGKVWLLPVGFSVDKFNGIHYLQVFNGSFLFTSEEGNISGLNEFINTVSPVTHPFEKYFLIEEMWRRLCIPYDTSISKKACIENSTLEELPQIKNNDKHLVSFIYSVYTAVYALAHALHDMYTAECHQESIHFFFKKLFHPRKLIWYLNHVHFKTPSGDEIFFDDKGDRPGKFDLYNWVLFQNGSTRSVKIGQYHSNSPNTSKIIFNESDIKWGPNITGTPHSVCSNSCLPGYQKMRREGQPICCYDCIPCKEGEITNRTDMEDCLQCSEDEWADDIKVECIKRTIYFLSIQDPVGASLTMATVGSCIITIIVMVIFIKHRDTPIVKASNWELSYILLVTLFLCFLCSFLIIGRPNYFTCLLQQVTFSILFTTAVSSVLAKTITVLVAFRSTKPGRRMNIHTGRIISYSIILLCLLVEVVICTIWLVYSPPFPDRDAHSEMGKLILQCNVGSSIAFYSSLGFIGVLALFSFIVAFLTRKLPDQFNEAYYITFSMLVFGSVWISFIPVYLSTKGKYLVAVEIFAILASSAALLGFIFIPKCYIIMFRPHLNIKENICASKTN